jgi:hypothetical protein|tara:strand:+ start:165 stop:524 length:360 start_codon:yes stop_codon:yes gene_type:complete
MNNIIKLIALIVLTLALVLTYMNKAKAGGPWDDQYCDVEITKIKVVDQSGNLIEEQIEETVTCNDGASDFLYDSGIAESCQMFTWNIPLGGEIVQQRQIICDKMDGSGYELVKGYHNLD